MDSNLVIKNQPVLSKIFNNIRKTNNNVQAYMLVGEAGGEEVRDQ